MRFRPWWAALVLLPACSGQSGGEAPFDDSGLTAGADEAAACHEIGRRRVALDELTPLGFSAQDVLDDILRQFEATLTYRDGIYPSTSITAEPVYSQGDALFIDTDREPGADDTVFDCQDHLEIALDVMLNTNDGVIAETLPVQVRAIRPALSGFTADIDSDSVQGTFRFEDFDDSRYDRRRVVFRVTFDDGSTTGSIHGLGEIANDGTNTGTASQTTIDIGLWPAAAGE